MTLQPLILETTLITSDNICKYNFKNAYEKTNFRNLQVEYSVKLFEKNVKKIYKQNNVQIVLFVFSYFLSSNKPFIKFSKKKQLNTINIVFDKNCILYFNCINLLNIFITKSFIHERFLSCSIKLLFKYFFAGYRYKEEIKKIYKK